jgi:hypothetical protein
MAELTHSPYSGRSARDGEADFRRLKIVAAFLHKRGKRLGVVPAALPISSRVTLRLNTPKPEKKD